MKLETFFDNFEVLAEAPNGVKKLREMILQLAVRGKLVAPDEKDEPASVLLKSIRDQIKKSSNSIEENEITYDLPKTWEWVHLGDILVFEYGDGLPKSKRAENAKYPVYGSNGIVGYHDEFLIDKPGIIVGRKGSCGALNLCLEPFWPTDVSYYIIPPEGIDLKFAFILLKSLNLERLGKGIKPGLNRNEAYQLVTSLPPYNEQRRIVAKVDQLMSLCDELEARQRKKRESRARLNSAALDRLLAARAPGEFAEGWRRISDNFDLLYDVPENVGALRKAILQLAVQGKLVPQNSNDEPASILLERIIVEKKKLMKEGKIKETGVFSIENENIPFELPSGWKWTCLYDIGKINPRNNTEDDKEVSFIPMTLISETSIKPIGSEKRRWGEVKKGFTHFAEDDVVLAKITPCFQNGKSAVMSGLTNKLGAGTTELHVFRQILNESVYPEYVLLYLRSPQFLSEGVEKMTGTAGQKRVPKEYFAGNPFPLPPFEEQRRIVSKVDQLMSLCDNLEAGLMRSQADSERLMEAAVGKMLAGGDNS